jgi:hypothetical protein
MSAAPNQAEIARVLDNQDSESLALFQRMSPPPPEAVQGYLGMLALLSGVPFENLVADARMLPPESIRFFYIDANWIASMIDGALSTGVHSDRDIRFSRAMRDVVAEVADTAAGQMRSRLRGEVPPASLGGVITAALSGPFEIVKDENDTLTLSVEDNTVFTITLTQGARTAQQIADELNSRAEFNQQLQATVSGAALSLSVKKTGQRLKLGSGKVNTTLGLTLVRGGFLMRSAVVSGFPGLEVQGYRTQTEDENQRLTLMRMERLSPDVLLVIFDSVPDMVVINEPKETLHFGIGSIQEAVRNPETGEQIQPNPPKMAIPFRQNDPTVINVSELVTRIQGRLGANRAPLTSATLAIEMVDSAKKMPFQANPVQP